MAVRLFSLWIWSADLSPANNVSVGGLESSELKTLAERVRVMLLEQPTLASNYAVGICSGALTHSSLVASRCSLIGEEKCPLNLETIERPVELVEDKLEERRIYGAKPRINCL